MTIKFGKKYLKFNYNRWQTSKMWYTRLLDGHYIQIFKFTLIAKTR